VLESVLLSVLESVLLSVRESVLSSVLKSVKDTVCGRSVPGSRATRDRVVVQPVIDA
jgi:hypothetical protein